MEGCSRREISKVHETAKDVANLPAGLEREPCNGHAMNGAARTRSDTRWIVVAVAWAVGAAGELDDEALAHELGAICRAYDVSDCRKVRQTQPKEKGRGRTEGYRPS